MRTSEEIWKIMQEGVFVVAEIGKNFIQTEEDQSVSEYLKNAKKLIAAAKEAGADAVKFQTHNVEDEQLDIRVTAPHFSGTDRYAWVKRNTEAASLEFWQEVKRYADGLGIIFFSTPMSRGAAQLLEKVGVPLWKVSSADLMDFVMLDFLAGTGKPIIISSGMSTEEELDLAINFLRKRTNDIILLHCVSKYPCSPGELYLSTIPYLKERYSLPVGFSDHSLSSTSSAAACAAGAAVIEKHFSLSRDFWGSDHKVSLTPGEFAEMVSSAARGGNISPEQFGQGVKIMDEGEGMFRPIFRKSLAAGCDIPAGTVITKDMLYAMRPQQWAGGLPSEAYESVLGKKAARDLPKYNPITEDALASLVPTL